MIRDAESKNHPLFRSSNRVDGRKVGKPEGEPKSWGSGTAIRSSTLLSDSIVYGCRMKDGFGTGAESRYRPRLACCGTRSEPMTMLGSKLVNISSTKPCYFLVLLEGAKFGKARRGRVLGLLAQN